MPWLSTKKGVFGQMWRTFRCSWSIRSRRLLNGAGFAFFAGAVLFGLTLAAPLEAQQLPGGLQGLGGIGGGLGGLNGNAASQAQDNRDIIQRPAIPPAPGSQPPSRLEEIMSARAGARLQQFGYDQVGMGRAVVVPQAGAIQDDYILGTGDELAISLRGQENNALRVTVDRGGQVTVPRLAPIPAAGRTFGDFMRDLHTEVRRAYISTDVSAAIARVRQIRVLVSGEVNAPGQRNISGLSSVVDALLLSGGVRKTGSLRDIRIERGGRIISVDLYGILTSTGQADTTRLTDGDRILVPALGRTVAVSGLVRRPAIYELPPRAPSLSSSALLALAGGMEVRGRYRLSVLRIAANGGTRMEPLVESGGQVGDSEILFVQMNGDLVTGQATLSGGTGLAGNYPITSGNRLSDVIRSPGALGASPYTLFGVVARKDSRTMLRQLVAFTPLAVLDGKEDQALQSDDVIRVFSVNEVRLLAGTVRLYRQRQDTEQALIRNPLSAVENTTPAAQGRASIANAAPGGTLNAAPGGTLNAADQQRNDIARQGRASIANAAPGGTLNAADQQRNDIASLANTVDPVTQQTLDSQNLTRQQQQAREQAIFQQQSAQTNFQIQQTQALTSASPNDLTQESSFQPVPPVPAATDIPGGSRIGPAPNFLSSDTASGQIATNREVTDFADLARQLGVDQLVLVIFLIDHQAVLNGAVSGPGSYFVGPGVLLQDLVQAAGGTSNWADESGVELISTAVDRQSGRSATQRTLLPLRQGMLANYVVHPQDQFRFNQVFTDSGLGSATIQGEVRFPGTFQITRGEHLSTLLSRAGGLTNTAYPAGSVFLRKSAAETERAGYIRAAAEIEDELVVAMTHIGNDKIDPGSFTALQGFVNSLRTQKAIGRIAIVADPSMLAAQPELDPLLEPGDVLYIPQRPTTIAVLGQVMQQGGFPYRSGLTLGDYIDQAGGYSASSDASLTFIVLPNGSARRAEKSWLSFDVNTLPPGSTIVVPRDVTPLNTRQMVLDITSIFSQFAVSLASLAVLAKQ